MYSYVSSRLLLSFIIILTALILISYAISGDLDEDKFISFLKIFLFELPIASSSAIVITYTFFLTDNKLAALQSRNLTSAFTPSLFFTISIILIIIILQEIALPYLAKQKLLSKGVKDVIFSIDKNKLLLASKVEFDKKNNVYLLKATELIQKNTFHTIKSYRTVKYDPIKNTLTIEGKSLELDVNLEKIFIFFTDKNYFFSIWEFNNVKDSFFVSGLKTSFLNFIMYEKIFIPTISFVIMVFCITISWRWRISRESKIMPLYITIGSIIITVIVKMIYYLSVRVFEFIVFPF